MIAALETGNFEPLNQKRKAAKGPKAGQLVDLWDSELAGHRTMEPAPRGPRPVGSGNFGPVANAVALAASQGRDLRAASYLMEFYRRQGPEGDLGHMLFEPLSHTYGDAHITAALLTIAMARRWKEAKTLQFAAQFADLMLGRELALCLLHRAPNGRIIHAGTRSNAPEAGYKSPRREEFVRLAFGKQKVGDGRLERAYVLARWSAPVNLWDAGRAMEGTQAATNIKGGPVKPEWLQPQLGEIRFASGPLVVTQYKNGIVSRWESGPVCYQSPMPVNVAKFEPWEVRPLLLEGKGHTKLRSEIKGNELYVWQDEAMILLDGLDLGAVVAEHRIPGIPL